MDLPGHEKVKFGDIVEAPPKLTMIPKALKTPQNASQQRLRLQAIEAYRNRRGWASQPLAHLYSKPSSRTVVSQSQGSNPSLSSIYMDLKHVYQKL
ncbi:hypothetical protein NL676_009635 [Syzygium grande]|nr:hypothetical protein NL676_009635 [Syzygium grande]